MKENSVKKNRMAWGEFPKVNSAKMLQDYLTRREYEHSRYFHYAKAYAINSILTNHSLWLSCVSGFNDTKDKEQFYDQNCYYSICFSTGLNENLPLWYLYSGIDGMGARLELTKSIIEKLIDSSDYYLYKWDNEKKELGECILKLEKDITMRRYFGDVIYRAPYTDADFVDLKYNTMTNHSGTVDFKLVDRFKNSLCQQCEKNKPAQNETTESK